MPPRVSLLRCSKPDMVEGFLDLQAHMGRELYKRGVPVRLFNQRSIAEILQTVCVAGALAGRAEASEKLRAGRAPRPGGLCAS